MARRLDPAAPTAAPAMPANASWIQGVPDVVDGPPAAAVGVGEALGAAAIQLGGTDNLPIELAFARDADTVGFRVLLRAARVSSVPSLPKAKRCSIPPMLVPSIMESMYVKGVDPTRAPMNSTRIVLDKTWISSCSLGNGRVASEATDLPTAWANAASCAAGPLGLVVGAGGLNGVGVEAPASVAA